MQNEVLLPSAGLVRDSWVSSTRRESRFFQGMSLFLFAIVLTGFSRTFFLRSAFSVPPIAVHVYAHALLMTGWFVLFIVQTSLIAVHRVDLHRRLGILGAMVATCLIVVTTATTLGLPAHYKIDPAPNGVPMTPDGMIGIVWGNFGAMVLFTTFVGAAIGLRRRTDIHKRLMLMASIVLVGPAVGRYIAYLNIWKDQSSAPHLVSLLVILVALTVFMFPLTLVVHDLRTTRRLHPSTLWSATGYWLVGIGSNIALPATAAGRALVIALQ